MTRSRFRTPTALPGAAQWRVDRGALGDAHESRRARRTVNISRGKTQRGLRATSSSAAGCAQWSSAAR